MTTDAPELFHDAEWSWLVPHLERDAIVLVYAPPSLEEAAQAIAENDQARVQAWIQTGALRKPTPEQVKAWNDNPGRTFRVTIVQPYVLAEETFLN